jgi:hypothetical protein
MENVNVLAGALLIGAAFLILCLPVAECDQCTHCRHERIEQKRKSDEAQHKAVHRFYRDLCPICRKDKPK